MARSIELADYFNYYPYLPKELPQMHDTFSMRVEIPYEENRDRILLTFGSAIPEKPETLSFLLDLDYIMTLPEKLALEQAGEWLEKAHTIIEKTFEACITDKCRKLFE